mmetsp:Transcript_269/g.734  ORF Transcript_269/g.734 Transcript_269/m.734 type:complete len:151 (+) Transcript_269:126-578(+)|eukprot:CAMPEP_0119123248 /NCGR_PEP_ID=MMETSP1310-20130426/3253_1 /TAXON_ID=464262 /ORGANISM="Genus nov. species nov., Strain RCC2339" /LENGTH=150 /DNA_ID=CAMNT_0007113027 /DNA_START=65 /DNA_END=517 /DNA_ORIENTATION=+
MDLGVFVYGSLMSERVLWCLLERKIAMRPARLVGYSRKSIRGRVYPAIVPQEGGTVEGMLLALRDEKEVTLLDEFEADEYIKQTVEVDDLDNNTNVFTQAYIWSESLHDMLDDQAWSYSQFEKDHLTTYLVMCTEFGREARSQLGFQTQT